MYTQDFFWLMIAVLIPVGLSGCRSAEVRLDHPQSGVRVTCRFESLEESAR